MPDPNPRVAGQGHWKLAESGVEVEVGVGAEEAHRVHAGHIRRMRDGRPHTVLKIALSADGKVALSGRRPVSISAEAARRRVHLMRAMSDAVATGIGTVLADDPQLTCRLPGMSSPVRLVFDSRLRLPLGSRLVASASMSPLWVLTGRNAAQAVELELRARGIEVIRVQEATVGIDLPASLRLLAERGITRVMIEAGPVLATMLLRSDLVDEAILFRSPKIIGADGIDALEGLPLSALTHSPRLRRVRVEEAGADTIEMFERPVS
jgi:diaminohydroxyphosphoribosylaminopyrimidine deaminase / 5-amino-6-(5-phosphoribosylamino)uracil reductase